MGHAAGQRLGAHRCGPAVRRQCAGAGRAARHGNAPPWRAEASLDGPLAPARSRRACAQPQAPRPEQARTCAPGCVPSNLAARRAAGAHAGARPVGAVAQRTVTSLTGEASAQTAASTVRREERLPVRELVAEARARPDDPRTIDVPQLAAELGSQALTGGRIDAQGRWTPAAWTVDATLHGVQPSQLDARAAAMVLSGPLKAAGRDFDRGIDQAGIDLQAELAGQFAGRGPAREATEGRCERIGGASSCARRRGNGARATLAGRAQRSAADAPWQVQRQATLVDFDPAPWWPGREARRGGAAQTNCAKGEFALASRPARGRVAVGSPRRAARPRRRRHRQQRDGRRAAHRHGIVAQHRGHGDGRFFEAGCGGNHRRRRTARHRPRHHRPMEGGHRHARARTARAAVADGTRRRGVARRRAERKTTASGRWPALATGGRLDANGLRVGRTRVDRAQARWQVDARAATMRRSTCRRQPAQITFSQALFRELRRSSRCRRRCRARARAPHRAAGADEGCRLRGRYVPAATGGRCAAGARRRRTALPSSMSAAAPSLRAGPTSRGVGGAAACGSWSCNGAAHRAVGRRARRRRRAALGPIPPACRRAAGPRSVLGASLRWSRVAWQAATGAQPAQVERRLSWTLTIAPLLAPGAARLRLGRRLGGGRPPALAQRAHVRGRRRARTPARRSHGDRRDRQYELGLSDLRIGLDVQNGVWNFTRTAGDAGRGGRRLRRAPRRNDMADAGRRCRGCSGAGCQPGHLGPMAAAGLAPHRRAAHQRGHRGPLRRAGIHRRVRGSGIGVRNLLGVNVTDGDVAIALQGTTARIDASAAAAAAR